MFSIFTNAIIKVLDWVYQQKYEKASVIKKLFLILTWIANVSHFKVSQAMFSDLKASDHGYTVSVIKSCKLQGHANVHSNKLPNPLFVMVELLQPNSR